MPRTPARLGAARMLLAAVSLAIAVPLAAQTGKDLPRVTVSAAAGFSRSLNGQFRENYGAPQVPASVQLDCRLTRRIGVFTAFRYLRVEGNTTIEEPAFPEESLPLRFRMYSAKFGGSIAGHLRRVALQAGAGVSSNWYREEVGVVNLSIGGNHAGFLAQGTAVYPLKNWFWLLGMLEFTSVPSSADPQSGNRINLGGVELAVGARFRIF